jgi:hypothetical protein
VAVAKIKILPFSADIFGIKDKKLPASPKKIQKKSAATFSVRYWWSISGRRQPMTAMPAMSDLPPKRTSNWLGLRSAQHVRSFATLRPSP